MCIRDSASRVRDYISDSASYKKIFELYENKRENTPLFVFNVTMQDHGGYDWDGDGYFDKRIYLTGKEQDKLSLIHISATAAGAFMPSSTRARLAPL